MVQWLGLGTFTAIDLGSNPSWGTKISQVAWYGQKKRNKENKTESVFEKKKREMKTYTHKKKTMYANYHSSIFHTSQKLVTT